MEIAFGPQVCGTLAEAALREWLVADGLGGYAMGTVAGLRTRRYHGLLVLAGATPGQRNLGLAALEPVLVIGERRVRLASDEWAGGVVDPQGHTLLESFDLEDGVPRWRWSLGPVVIEREIAFDAGRAAVAVVHRLLRADRAVGLELTPLCTWRDAHGERFAGGDPALEPVAGGFEFEGRYRVLGPGWQPGGGWYRGVRYREEAATLVRLGEIDQMLVGQAELLRVLLDQKTGPWIIEHAASVQNGLQALGRTLDERQAILQ